MVEKFSPALMGVCTSKPPFVWKTSASSVVAPVYERPSEEGLVCVNSVKRNNKVMYFLKLVFLL